MLKETSIAELRARRHRQEFAGQLLADEARRTGRPPVYQPPSRFGWFVIKGSGVFFLLLSVAAVWENFFGGLFLSGILAIVWSWVVYIVKEVSETAGNAGNLFSSGKKINPAYLAWQHGADELAQKLDDPAYVAELKRAQERDLAGHPVK